MLSLKMTEICESQIQLLEILTLNVYLIQFTSTFFYKHSRSLGQNMQRILNHIEYQVNINSYVKRKNSISTLAKQKL